MANEKLLFLDMKMSWSPERGLQFKVFGKKGQQLKYVGNGSTHTPGTLQAISSGLLIYLAKLTSRKPIFNSERVEKVYPNHVKYLCKAGL